MLRMKPGLYGQQLTLMEELKAASFVAHARLQAAPMFQALVSCQLPLESYVGQLRALSVVHGVLERALDACADPRVASVWNGDMRKFALLQQDLRFFEPRAVADLKEAAEAALKIAEYLRPLSVEQPLSLLGWVYVLEGATLGATVLRPLYARAFLLEGEDGLSYLHSYGPAVRAHWAQLQRRMNALPLGAEEREQIGLAVNISFTQLEAVFQALYPFQPESKTFFVTSINPEAGRHPVPADSREVEAALRAADACWERFPYFAERYGERGWRFARSDAAWLATLYHYQPAQILQQLRWLGRVLAGRGMPTLLLQDQVEILVQHLTAAVPEKQSEYARLLPAAAELHASRCQHLSDDEAQSIADQFDNAVGPELSVRYAHSGALIAAAVADEHAGLEGTVGAILPWLSDATRFPEGWIAAVQQALVQARSQCSALSDS